MWVGWDIGGANIKQVVTVGDRVWGQTSPFPIWKERARLSEKLCELFQSVVRDAGEHPGRLSWYVTMTAELADCYETKSEGVRDIVRQVNTAAAASGGINCWFWSVTGEWFSSEQALQNPLVVAAGNWHALATWLGHCFPSGHSLLLDLGSTTCDLIPIRDGQVVVQGMSDPERLATGELVYTGVERTPLCALGPTIPFRGFDFPLSAEFFATTRDVYLLTGELPESPEDRNTANGQPATQAAAHDRIARQFCSDRDELSRDEALQLAHRFREIQISKIEYALGQVCRENCCFFPYEEGKWPDRLILSGSGRFLLREIVSLNRPAELVDLGELLTPELSMAACAYALVQLARNSSGSEQGPRS